MTAASRPGDQSSFRIQPVACPMSIVAFVALLRFMKNECKRPVEHVSEGPAEP